MLGYDLPRDFHVHGVPQVPVNDLANRNVHTKRPHQKIQPDIDGPRDGSSPLKAVSCPEVMNLFRLLSLAKTWPRIAPRGWQGLVATEPRHP